jgi:hypothetical protein
MKCLHARVDRFLILLICVTLLPIPVCVLRVRQLQDGVVPPEGRLAIEVTFCPLEEKAFNFNVPCTIQKKPTQLSLNVKGEGYAVHDSLVRKT